MIKKWAKVIGQLLIFALCIVLGVTQLIAAFGGGVVKIVIAIVCLAAAVLLGVIAKRSLEQLMLDLSVEPGNIEPQQVKSCPGTSGTAKIERRNIMYCRKCGKGIEPGSAFCPHCGEKVVTEEVHKSQIRCPHCGSGNVDVQIHEEEGKSKSVTKTKSKYKEKGHGCIWWLTIGWWWWVVDLFMWIFVFPIRFLIQLFKKKKYKGNATSVTETSHKTVYKSVFLCKNCGHHWEK